MQASLVTQGGSRASKKRAKKKHKKQTPERDDVYDDKKGQPIIVVKPSKKPRVQESQKDPVAAVKTENKNEKDGPPVPWETKVPTESILHFLHPENPSVPAAIRQTLDDMTAKERAQATLAFILHPADVSVQEFHDNYWEKKPLLVQASSSGHRHRLDGLLSIESIRQMLHNHPMAYGRDLNVTKYTMDLATGKQRRLTLDRLPKTDDDNHDEDDHDEGDKQVEYIEARPGEVWKHYGEGCTVRLLCPHQYSDSVQALLSLLEVEWGCMVGANAYLTPPNASQGFAPHYDDIEAFCLQLSGRKRWKVYPPFPGKKLPRVSSPDYTEEDLKEIEPVMDVVLSPGDMLYMPRGWIHQACTLEGGANSKDDGHSLHLTVSAMQQWGWCDFFEVLLPEALNAAANSESSTALREGLPRNFLDYMGAVHDDSKESEVLSKARKGEESDAVEVADKKAAQEHFRAEAKNRIMRVAKEAMDMLDAACDQMGKQYIASCQPPALITKEREMTSLAETKAVKILPDMLVRLVRPGVARLVLEDGMAVLYHCMDNSRVFHDKPISPMEFETDDAPAIEQLLTTLEPHWICVADLFHDTVEDKVGVVQALYDEGVLALRH